jgi:hypothetical protein
MSFSVPTGTPGVQPTTYTTTPRDIFWGQPQMAQYLAFPSVIDGSNSYNALNQPYNWLLWAGTLMGIITSSGKYAPSILGLTSQGVGGSQTTLYTDPNTAQCIVLRADLGTSGTMTITGPPYPSGPVRIQTVTYSNVNTSTGAITITALNNAAVAGVNCVQTLDFVDNTGSGTFTIAVEGVTTGAITYNATAATLVSNINAALNTAFGPSEIVATGSAITAIALTFSGGSYAQRPIALVALGTTGLTNVTVTATITTAGVRPAEVAGVNAVQALDVVDSTGSGTFSLTIEGTTTAAITYSATAATLVSNINTALTNTYGAGNGPVASGASLAAIILTYSGINFENRPVGLVVVNPITLTGATFTPSTTTAGVAPVPLPFGAGVFIAGSILGPNDGSQTPITLIVNKNGTKVVDQLNTTRVDVLEGQLWGGGGIINTGYIVNYPTDPSLQKWVKNAIKAFVVWALFNDDYIT